MPSAARPSPPRSGSAIRLLHAIAAAGASAACSAPAYSAPPPTPARPAAEVCAARSPCRVVDEQAAGRDKQGRDLAVVKLALSTERPESGRPDAGPEGPSCEPFEEWLVARAKGAVVEKQLLLAICNDGYGASGVGEDNIEVKPDWFLHRQYGGSSWRWADTLAIGLAPVRRRVEESEGYWNLGANFVHERWSWDDFAGRLAWFSPPCGKEGEPAGEDDEEIGGGGNLDKPPARAFAYDLIPQVDLAAAYRAGGWRTTELGACAARLDGDKRGFVLHGKPDGPTDASLRLVASSQGELFVEVRDDTFVGPSASWLADDHLELWASRDELPTYDKNCLEPAGKVDLRQWGIRLADGAVFPGHGKPDGRELRTVERASAQGVVRVKLGLPAGLKALAVVYSDSDGGKRQEWLLGSARLRFGKQLSLGKLHPIKPEDATCEIVGGRLEPKGLPAYKPAAP